ncbi:MAG: hypothetical protein GYA24_24835 [Candidatus Lokiarchaeota archaeon]|nr:hypothetical protein [Candidatus Lokiarchaeota archaeon]
MSAPTGLKMGPMTNCVVPSKWHVVLVLVEMWLAIIPAILLESAYFAAAFAWNPTGFFVLQYVVDFILFIEPWGRIVAWLLFPFNLLAVHYLNAFCAIKVAKSFLFFETRLHPPREGIFPRDFMNPDYYHWHARRAIKKFPCWLLQLTPFTAMKGKYIYNQLGLGTVRVGKAAGTIDSWIDSEFVEIQDDVAIGRAASITSHYFTPTHLVIKKVTLGAGCIVGERARVLPGVVLGERSTVLAKSVVRIDEQVPARAIFGGNPATLVPWDPSASSSSR